MPSLNTVDANHARILGLRDVRVGRSVRGPLQYYVDRVKAESVAVDRSKRNTGGKIEAARSVAGWDEGFREWLEEYVDRVKAESLADDGRLQEEQEE